MKTAKNQKQFKAVCIKTYWRRIYSFIDVFIVIGDYHGLPQPWTLRSQMEENHPFHVLIQNLIRGYLIPLISISLQQIRHFAICIVLKINRILSKHLYPNIYISLATYLCFDPFDFLLIKLLNCKTYPELVLVVQKQTTKQQLQILTRECRSAKGGRTFFDSKQFS